LQILRFFELKPCIKAFFYGCYLENITSEQQLILFLYIKRVKFVLRDIYEMWYYHSVLYEGKRSYERL